MLRKIISSQKSLSLITIFLGLTAITYPLKAATISLDFTNGSDGNFTSSGSPLWSYTGSQWQTKEANNATSFLTSTKFEVRSNNKVTINLTHAYNFEEDDNFFDGGLFQISINEGEFTTIIPEGGYPVDLAGDGCAVFGIDCWSGDSNGFVQDTLQITEVLKRDIFQIRFLSQWDRNIFFSNPNWAIQSITLDNSLNVVVPEPTALGGLLVIGGIGFLKRVLSGKI